jgi:choline-sulfatase
MSASVPPPSSRALEIDVRVLHSGALVGRAAVASLMGTLPAMLRISGALAGSAPAVRAWAALFAAALGPMGLALVVLSRARRTLSTLGGPGTRFRAFGLGLWLASLLVALALFGSVLRATTHHHGLAGVTFACGALALAVGWGLVCARVVAMLQGASEGVRRLAVISLAGTALVAVGYLGLTFVLVVLKDPSSAAAGATVVDVIAFALAALLASREWRAALRPLAIVGPPVAVFLVALGITTLRDPPVRRAIGEHAPAFVSAADRLSGR